MRPDQATFAMNVAMLILQMSKPPYYCTLGEAYRPPELCEIYAKDGRGIKKSMHEKRLAIDLNLFLHGVYQTTTEAHAPFGAYWLTLHPRNRWGGAFGDGNHYSMMEEKGDTA